MTDFSEFGEILEQSSYVGLIHVGKWESRRLSTGKARRIMQNIVGEDLKTLAKRLPVQYRDFVEIYNGGTGSTAVRSRIESRIKYT